jgi:hypothetical protein
MKILALILIAAILICFFKYLGHGVKKWSEQTEGEPNEWTKVIGIDGKIKWIKKTKSDGK